MGTATLTFSNLTSGSYTLTGFHNDDNFPGQFQFSATGVTGVQASDISGALTIVSGSGNTPVNSVITFTTDGVADTVITFTATAVGTVFNGFELEGPDPVVPAPVPAPTVIWLLLLGIGLIGIRKKVLQPFLIKA